MFVRIRTTLRETGAFVSLDSFATDAAYHRWLLDLRLLDFEGAGYANENLAVEALDEETYRREWEKRYEMPVEMDEGFEYVVHAAYDGDWNETLRNWCEAAAYSAAGITPPWCVFDDEPPGGPAGGWTP